MVEPSLQAYPNAMKEIAHIIHPCLPPPGSDLHVAQPITFATMLAARDFAEGQVAVQLYAVKQHDEDFALPIGFMPTPDLTRSVYDLGKFQQKRKLAFIQDILDRLYAAAEHADYLIYTNVDIALQPHFYVAVNQLLDQGYDALVINRRTLLAPYQSVAEIPLMYAAIGERHTGHDCFIFKRSAYPHYQLGQTCIGAVGIGATLGINLLYHAAHFKEFTGLHLTFHLGKEGAWQADAYWDYMEHNVQEFRQIIQRYRAERPDFRHSFIDRVEERVAYMMDARQPKTMSSLALRRRIKRQLRRFYRYALGNET